MLVSVAGLIWLVSIAPTSRARIAAWVYGLSGVLGYTASATYHVFARSPRSRRIMQRVDHSTIYLLIAGTFTPMAVLAMRGPWRWAALSLMWAGAAGGVALKVFAWSRYRRFTGALYVMLGAAGLIALPWLLDQTRALAFILAGGFLYLFAVLLFALRRPRLSPTWFGYHEVWHALGVAAGVLIFVANFGLIRGG